MRDPGGADEELDADAVARIVREIEAGEDSILVPFELIGDFERPPGTAPPPSLFQEVLGMSVSQKIKLALRGNKDARTILIRDNNKLVRRFVVMNPRITDGEVVQLCRNRSADDELIRIVAEDREWVRNYQVKLALVTNPKTPLVIAMRLVAQLGERDVRALAKSRNVPQAVAVQARRIVVEKDKKSSGGGKH
ncbi:MAG: hypothetical protein KIT14_12990 [bacterium]|nr:hypothetical protein [bacterium]